jgi:predicted lipoprotein with Yx(FWY)xxD motif
MNHYSKSVIGTGLTVFLLVTACSNGVEGESESAAEAGGGSGANGYGGVGSEESHGDHGVEAKGQASLETADDAALGEVLTDGDGNVLYLFTDDAPAESTCLGGCADNWPPLRTSADAGTPAELAEGLSAELLGSIPREDGAPQVTYNDWPLYTYTGDAAPGDTNGQGVGSAWYVLGPQGQMITDAASYSAPADSGGPQGAGGADDPYGDDGGGYGGGDYRQHPLGS